MRQMFIACRTAGEIFSAAERDRRTAIMPLLPAEYGVVLCSCAHVPNVLRAEWLEGLAVQPLNELDTLQSPLFHFHSHHGQ
jgi:hypothetical protein